jgi:hypothetical protein
MKKQINAQIELIKILADTIKEAKQIPNGHLYAAVMGVVNLDVYQSCIGILKRSGLVNETYNMLIWVEPKKEESNVA